MTKEMTVITLGIWVIIVPYLGVPISWRTGILIITGLCIVLVGFLLRARTPYGKIQHRDHPFVENTSMQEGSNSHDRKERITSLN